MIKLLMVKRLFLYSISLSQMWGVVLFFPTVCAGQPEDSCKIKIQKIGISVNGGLKLCQGTGYHVRFGFDIHALDWLQITPTIGMFSNVHTRTNLDNNTDTFTSHVMEGSVRVIFIIPSPSFGTIVGNPITEITVGTIMGVGGFYRIHVGPRFWVAVGITAQYNYIVENKGWLIDLPMMGIGMRF